MAGDSRSTLPNLPSRWEEPEAPPPAASAPRALGRWAGPLSAGRGLQVTTWRGAVPRPEFAGRSLRRPWGHGFPPLTFAGLGRVRALVGLGFHSRKCFSQPGAAFGVVAASTFPPEVCAFWLEVLGSTNSPALFRDARNSANRCSMAGTPFRARPPRCPSPGGSASA